MRLKSRVTLRSLAYGLGMVVAFGAAVYAGYAGVAWLGFGHPRSPKKDEADALLDAFMPEYEIVERHHTLVQAPAGITMAVACELDFDQSRIVRTIFKGRQFLLHGQSAGTELPRGLLAKTKALGWGVLAEIPGREIVMGAATQPWLANVKFRPIPAGQFASFRDPGYVKIAWTLRADPVSAGTSIFRTETRAVAYGPVPSSKFRKYWAFLSPGIILIRLAMLGPLRQAAKLRAAEDRLTTAAGHPA